MNTTIRLGRGQIEPFGNTQARPAFISVGVFAGLTGSCRIVKRGEARNVIAGCRYQAPEPLYSKMALAGPKI